MNIERLLTDEAGGGDSSVGTQDRRGGAGGWFRNGYVSV